MVLSKTKEGEIEQILSMENHKENLEYILPNSYNEHLNLINNKDIEHLKLRIENEEIIGFVILAGLENKNKNIEFRRIVINEKGKGFGRKAIQEIKRHCFENLNCHRLWLDVLETNERAKHLYQSEGFKQEGRLRDCLLINGEFKSLVIMSILEIEYKSTITNKELT